MRQFLFTIYKGLTFGEYSTLYNAYITTTPITTNSLLTTKDWRNIGLPSSNNVGRAIPNCHNFFTLDRQLIAGFNTNAYNVIELNKQNYQPFQPYNNGLYGGLLVKVDKDQA